MSPEKMIVAKIVSHRDLERKVLLAIDEFGDFEFIDVRRQAGLIDIKRTKDEEAVFVTSDRLDKLITSLGLNPHRRVGQVQEVDDSILITSLKIATDTLNAVENEVLEIDTNLIIAKTELERQRGIKDVANSPLQQRVLFQQVGSRS